jgi:hypothetical protein
VFFGKDWREYARKELPAALLSGILMLKGANLVEKSRL